MFWVNVFLEDQEVSNNLTRSEKKSVNYYHNPLPHK